MELLLSLMGLNFSVPSFPSVIVTLLPRSATIVRMRRKSNFTHIAEYVKTPATLFFTISHPYYSPSLCHHIPSLLKGLRLMTSTKFSNFLCPSPSCPQMELIYTTKSTQSPLLCALFHDPPSPPSDADIISGCSLFPR